MNYERIYNQLIEKRKVHKLTGYTETHHIQPKSLGGSDSKDNLIELTAREHFIAHLLLAKFKPCFQTINAIMIMRCKSNTQCRVNIQNSRMYEWAKKQFSKYMKVRTKGVGNSQYCTMWICNIELEENKKISKNDIIPEGWIKGRSAWNEISRKTARQESRVDERAEKIKQKSAFFTKIYDKMIKESLTLQECANKYYDKSFVSLYYNFEKHVSDYKKTQGKRKSGV